MQDYLYSDFAHFLATQVIDRVSGRVMPIDAVDGEIMLRRPADVFFIGSVGPEAAVTDDMRLNTAPPAMGLDFFIKTLGPLRIRGTFCYYRSEFPSLAICQDSAKHTNDPEFDTPIASRAQKGSFDVTIELEPGSSRSAVDIPDLGLDRSYGAPAQANRYRLNKDALASETDFAAAKGSLRLTAPSLKLAASVSTTVSEDPLRGYRVQVRLINESVNTRWATEQKHWRRIDAYEEPFLFDVNLTVELGSLTIVPMLLDLEADDFRYDNMLWVDGFNSGAEYDPGSGILRTRYAPMAEQRRVKHRSGNEDLRFGSFAQDPLSQLRTLVNEMELYRKSWPPSTLQDPALRKAEDTDRQRFAEELERFRTGVDLIENDARVRTAFFAAMEVFASIWSVRDPRGQAAWRRFQIVFIVSVIAGLAGRAASDYGELEIVDILWFPTGGGKTEAYLAILLWQAFFDRLRGKKAGVTAMMRFPLRLLSLQQMQRVIEAVSCAEQVRLKNPEFNGDRFNVGFLVGSNATRNKLTDSDIQIMREQMKLPFAKRSDWVRRHRVVAECPFCHEQSVDIRIDEAERLIHYCTGASCKKQLPLYVIDEEAYRYLPTVLVGTVDKLALIGQNIRWRQLLGYVDTKCTLHGFSSGGKCSVYGCTGSISGVKLFDAAPAIEIQDELHLLREELGVVASHYETVAHAIARKNGIGPIKVIASTATIQDHERQAKELYARKSRQFPALGRTLSSSFYADVQDYNQRLFVGIMPRRLTHINALMQLMQTEHELIQGLRNRTIGQSVVPEADLDGVLDYYEVVVTYTLRRIDQDRVDGSIDSQVNPYLVRRGLRQIRNQPMTANTTTEEVTAILAALETPPAKIDERLSSITATSMISHGVDVNRLNIMNFFGMPFSAAEYIQSSSRVGRFVCGCVFVVYQAHKERERSHYQRFLKYHEFQNRLVEPVPLNRWASRGLYFTAPGLVMAAIFALFGSRWTGANRRSLWLAKEVLKAFDQRTISVAEVVKALVDALEVPPADRQRTEDYLERVVREGLERARIVDAKTGFGGCMTPEPMQSLRDVEESFNVDVLGPNMWYVEAD